MAPTQSSPASPAGRQIAVERHLVLVNQRGWQNINDLYQIVAKVRWLDPTVGTFVVPAEIDDGVTREAAAALPTLVVSFGPMGTFSPKRGKVYHGGAMHKFEQLRRLHEAGVPVPRTAILGPDTDLDPRLWGDLVIVKPTDIITSSAGTGIELVRTSAVRYRPPEEYPEGHPGRKGPMFIQQFIDSGLKFSNFRVLTLFGRALYCNETISDVDRPPLTASDAELAAGRIATNGLAVPDRRKVLVHDADVLAVAEAAYRAIPEVPLQGCDVIRDVRTGRCYVLELNPGGNTWAFSSGFLAEMRKQEGPEFERARYAQFDAFSTAAHVLLERTRAEAE